MKKLILAAVTTACAASVFAQGTVIFNNRVAGTIITHVYSPLAPGSTVSRLGNGATDTPVGASDWTGFTLVGTTGAPNTAGGTFASLLGAPGFNTPESSLVAASGGGITTFRTGAAAGNIVGTTATFNNIAPDAPQATLEMVAWDNSSGLYPTWTQANAAWKSGLIAAGTSGTWNTSMGGNLPAPNMINPADPTQFVHSFNLYFVPEPTSAALLGLGAAAMLIFRRRK